MISAKRLPNAAVYTNYFLKYAENQNNKGIDLNDNDHHSVIPGGLTLSKGNYLTKIGLTKPQEQAPLNNIKTNLTTPADVTLNQAADESGSLSSNNFTNNTVNITSPAQVTLEQAADEAKDIKPVVDRKKNHTLKRSGGESTYGSNKKRKGNNLDLKSNHNDIFTKDFMRK